MRLNFSNETEQSWLLASQSPKVQTKKDEEIFGEKHDKNLLVELGLEELPAYVVTPSEKQLGEKMAAFLKENRLSFEAFKPSQHHVVWLFV